MTSKHDIHEKVLKDCGLLGCPDDTMLPLGFAVYGEDYCGHTSRARQSLKDRAIPFAYHRLGSNRRDFAQKYANGHRTIPMVFLDGRFIGGNDALQSFLSQQK